MVLGGTQMFKSTGRWDRGLLFGLGTLGILVVGAGIALPVQTATMLVATAFSIPTAILALRLFESHRISERLGRVERRDRLTGVLDREAFLDLLKARLSADAKIARGNHVLVRLSVDTRSGNENGRPDATLDEMLKCIGARLQRNVRDVDAVGRIGAREFGIFLSDLADPFHVENTVRRIVDAAAQPYRIARMKVSRTLSAGIALSPAHGTDAGTLMQNAWLSLETAQQVPGTEIRFFETGMETDGETGRISISDLGDALETGQFDVHYQPQVRLATGQICAHEALARWTHPELGEISPADFVPLAEESGFIVPLGEWILRRACEDAASWPEPRCVGVNLSPVQFQQTSVTALVRRALDESGLSAHELELEITESLLMSDADSVLRELVDLREMGVGIAMDDFGTGYSSLSYLSRYPISKIKIDRSFMLGLSRDRAASAIVSCIVSLGRSLDVEILAEGVETEEQARLLSDLGCDQGQGFLFGRPKPASDAAERLRGRGMLPATDVRQSA